MKNSRLALLSLLLLSGCASVTSVSAGAGNDPTGVIYHLPKKDVTLSFSVTDGKVSAVSVSTTLAYRDPTESYVLRTHGNLIGSVVSTIEVNSRGLLSTVKAETTSQLDNVVTALAGMPKLRQEGPARKPQCDDGTYTRILPAEPARHAICGLMVSIMPPIPPITADFLVDSMRSELNRPTTALRSEGTRAPTSFAGVYYRQEEPYLVTVSDTASGSVYLNALVFSPSRAPRRALSLGRSGLAVGKVHITLEDGILKRREQTKESELIALLTLPATVLSAYFGAVGALFSAFSNVDGKEASALNAAKALDLAKLKYATCNAAIREQKPEAEIQAACH